MQNQNPTQILSDITVHMKYARFMPDKNRRETWEEIVERNMNMHIKKFPQLEQEIRDNYKFVFDKKVLPSMRSLQFAGKPIETNPTRLYNCCFTPVNHIDVFSETMFLLLGGTGVGYSVQKHHIEQLPEIKGVNIKRNRRYLVGDSIEGWADAIKVLIESYFKGKSNVKFDYSDIRPKGALLVTAGGKAPGPQPLKDCVHNIRKILDTKEPNSQLKPIEAHDIMCHIADAVLSGGIRRAALISLFSADDDEMIACKSGAWWETNPQRGRANNSAFLLRSRVKKSDFLDLWNKIEASGSGEPGIYLSNDMNWGTNPCVEIALRSNQFCNLTETNVSNIESQEDLNERVRAASFIGTLQASYTDFHYLRPIWQRTTEKDALIGVSMTGIASNEVFKYDLEESANVVKDENARVANMIGINKAARTTCVKPAGTTSLVLGTSSGIHAWHNDYYLRRIRVNKNESIYSYLSIAAPDILEDEIFDSKNTAVIEIPQKAPDNATTRDESAFNLLDRVKEISGKWVATGHRNGLNGHNVSATISIKPDEWDLVADWMWHNRDYYNGLSVLPFDGGTYQQAPFEDISKQEYEDKVEHITDIDLSAIVETSDNTDLKDQAACAGGSCEV